MSKVITLTPESLSIRRLCARDKRLAKVIAMIGPITYTAADDSYVFLISTIIGQMLSNKVAAVLNTRLLDLCNGSVSPQVINCFPDEELRSIGISNAKVSYIRNLTSAVAAGIIDFDTISTLSDQEIIKLLTTVRGIGAWSAKMYLIFALDRPDVLPVEDIAFLQGYRWLYKTADVKPAAVSAKCQKWKPYSSIAARYLYRALDAGLTKEEFHLFK